MFYRLGLFFEKNVSHFSFSINNSVKVDKRYTLQCPINSYWVFIFKAVYGTSSSWREFFAKIFRFLGPPVHLHQCQSLFFFLPPRLQKSWDTMSKKKYKQRFSVLCPQCFPCFVDPVPTCCQYKIQNKHFNDVDELNHYIY